MKLPGAKAGKGRNWRYRTYVRWGSLQKRCRSLGSRKLRSKCGNMRESSTQAGGIHGKKDRNMKKGIILLTAAVMLAGALLGCSNKTLIDITYMFDRAIIQLAGGTIVDTRIKTASLGLTAAGWKY